MSRTDDEIRADLALHRKWPTPEVHEARTRLSDDVAHLLAERASPDTAALSAQTEACRALSAENERLKATLAKVRGLCDSTITFNDAIRGLVGAALDAVPTEEPTPETQRQRDARLIVEADLADERNDDAWLEDRGLL